MDLQRIKEMEERLNRCTAARADLDRQLGRMEELREDMIRLFAYYGSEDWYEDREGEIPKDVPAGVRRTEYKTKGEVLMPLTA